MIRLIIGILLIMVSTMIGCIINNDIKSEYELISNLNKDMRALTSMVKHERKSMSEILAYLSKFGKVNQIWKRMNEEFENSSNMYTSWKNATEQMQLSEKQYLKEFDSFFGDIGNGNIEKEVEKMDFFIDRIELIEKETAPKYQNKMKLIRVLSTFGGIALALIAL